MNENEIKDNEIKTEEKTTSQKVKDEIISWIKTIIFAFVAAWLITTFIIVNAKVPSGSMEDTIMTNDRLVAFRLSYTFSEPERGDIVVFKYPDDESVLYIKRIIGLPGETVEINEGNVYINGNLLQEDVNYATGKMYGSFGPYEVPEDSYFMLGDNRNNSKDSRFWNNHYVHKDKILGKAIFRYWPLNEISLLTNK